MRASPPRLSSSTFLPRSAISDRMASHAMEVGYDVETDFEFGLEIIFDELE